MSTSFDFTADFLAFARNGEWVAQVDDGVPVLVSDGGGGEIRERVITLETGDYRLTHTSRSRDPITILETADSEIVERYLTAGIGAAMRHRDNFLLLWSVDGSAGETAEGFSVQQLSESGWFVLVKPDGHVVPAKFRKRHDAVQYSYTAHASLPELYSSFLDPQGRPALHGAWLRWQARKQTTITSNTRKRP